MGFMEPQVYAGKAYVVETNHGTEIVPHDLAGGLMANDGRRMEVGVTVDGDGVDSRPLHMYLEPGAKIHTVELKRGYLARMSAPGCLDCTPWELHDTAAEAEASLRENYMDDDDNTDNGEEV